MSTLTGNIRYRSGWFGKLILQVEVLEDRPNREGMDFSEYLIWRDATVCDIPLKHEVIG